MPNPLSRDDFQTLVAEHHNAVWAISLAILRDPVRAEEAVQDAFLTAWQKRSALRDVDSFGPWIRTITRNRCRDLGRAAGRRARVEVGTTTSTDVEAPAAATDELEREWAVFTALNALETNDREVLVLFYCEGQSSKQVASSLGLSDSAVRQRIRRARDTLRRDAHARLAGAVHQFRPGAAALAAVFAAIIAWDEAHGAPAQSNRLPRLGFGIGAGAAVVASMWLLIGATPTCQHDSPEVTATTSSAEETTHAPTPPADVVVDVDPEPDSEASSLLDLAQGPGEEALFALAEAGSLGVARCDVGSRLAGGTLPLGQLGEGPDAQTTLAHFAIELTQAEQFTTAGTTISMALYADDVPTTSEEPVTMSMIDYESDTIVATATIVGATAGNLGECTLDFTHRPRVRGTPTILTEDEVLDLQAEALADVEQEDQNAADGSSIYQLALQNPRLSEDARATLWDWWDEEQELNETMRAMSTGQFELIDGGVKIGLSDSDD